MLLVLVVLLQAMAPAASQILITDLKGREVTLKAPAQRLIVDDGRLIVALSYISEDPVSLIAAWPHDVKRVGIERYAAFKARFPGIDVLPASSGNTRDLSVEQVIAAAPDHVVLSVYSQVSEQQLSQLAETGIPVIFVDFVIDPLGNAERSFGVLGQAIGRSAQAERFNRLRAAHISAVRNRLETVQASPRPVVFLETHASASETCCNSPGTENYGRLIELVAARNIGDILKGRPFGQIDREYIVAAAPEIYVASGGPYMAMRGGLLIGPSIDEEVTRQSMQALLDRPGFSFLPAVRDGRVHGLSSELFSPGLDMLVLELLAKWVHPAVFGDLDVEATRQAINSMAAVPLAGRYWWSK